MRNQGLPLHVNPTMRYKISSYWGTFNRVLQYPVWDEENRRHLDMIEFSLTTPNMTWDFEWPRVAAITIRKHGTSIDKKDQFTNVIPTNLWEYIAEQIGEERRDFMAFGNFNLDNIDWDKYAVLSYGGGGAAWDEIQKD